MSYYMPMAMSNLNMDWAFVMTIETIFLIVNVVLIDIFRKEAVQVGKKSFV